MSCLGTEVKAIREGRLNLKDSYALVQSGKCSCSTATSALILMETGKITIRLVHESCCCTRGRFSKLIGKTQEKGLTLVPLRVYLKRGRVKVELGVARGKKLIDKRETERRKDADREAESP